MNHNKIPQSLSLLTLHFGLAKSMSLQLTINLLYNRYWYYMAHLTELSSLDRAEDSWLSWWAKRLLLSWWANRFSMSLFHLWVSKGLLSLNHHYQMAQYLYWVGLLVWLTQQWWQAESCSTTSMYTAQGLSAEGAESGSTTGMYTAQWLSAEGAESGSQQVCTRQNGVESCILFSVRE